MASSVSGENGPNPSLRLANRAGKGSILPARDCPLCPARKIFFIVMLIMTKLVRLRWLDMPRFFLRVYGPRFRLGPSTRKKRT